MFRSNQLLLLVSARFLLQLRPVGGYETLSSVYQTTWRHKPYVGNANIWSIWEEKKLFIKCCFWWWTNDSPKHVEPCNEKIKTINRNLCISLVYIHIAIWCTVHTTSNRKKYHFALEEELVMAAQLKFWSIYRWFTWIFRVPTKMEQGKVCIYTVRATGWTMERLFFDSRRGRYFLFSPPPKKLTYTGRLWGTSQPIVPSPLKSMGVKANEAWSWLVTVP